MLSTAYSHSAHSHHSCFAPPVLPLRRFSHANNTSILSLKSVQIDDRWSPSLIPPIWNAVGGLRASVYFFVFFFLLALISLCSSRYSILSTEHKHILYPRACPRCPQLWGNVRCFKAHQICTLTQIHTECRGIRFGHTCAHTHTLNSLKEISLVWGCMHWFSPRSGLGGTSLAQSGECWRGHNSTG